MEATSLRFADVARTLADAARARGLRAPAFRSPPRLASAQRTVRRRGGSTTIAVRLAHRPWAAVVADMIEGVVVTNRLAGLEADGARSALWAAVEQRCPVAA